MIGDKVEQEYEDEAHVTLATSTSDPHKLKVELPMPHMIGDGKKTKMTNLIAMKLMLLLLMLLMAISDWVDC